MSGTIARPALALAEHGSTAGLDSNAGADGVAIAAHTHQEQSNPVVIRLRVVAQQRRRGVLVVDDQVDVAVIVEVAIGDSPPDVVGDRSSRRRRASRARTSCRPGCGASRGGSAYGLKNGSSDRGCRRRGRWRQSNRASRRCRSRPEHTPQPTQGRLSCIRPRERARSSNRPSPRLTKRASPSLQKLVTRISVWPSPLTSSASTPMPARAWPWGPKPAPEVG